MDIFEVIADPTRRRVIGLLGERPRRAGELSGALGMSPPAMSRHLRILLEAGVVDDERVADDARLRVFRLRPRSLAAVQAFLDQVPAFSARKPPSDAVRDAENARARGGGR